MEAPTPLRRPPREEARPFRRKPKQLTARPTVLEPGGGGVGGRALLGRGDRGPRDETQRLRSASIMTDESGELVEPSGQAGDPAVRAAAQRIAAALSLPQPRRDRDTHRGSGDLRTVPYRAGLDDIDVDRTLEVLATTPTPRDDEIFVRERARTRRSVVLAVDVSGSMRGERLRTAAATVGALAGELAHDHLAVLAFWSDAAWLTHLGSPADGQALVNALLALPGKGLTNIAFPLEIAARELAQVPARDARVVLLSDCVHNAGPDPRPFAARLPRLDVMLDVTGEKDVELGRELARLGRGKIRRVRHHRDVAPGLTAAFAR